MGDINSIWDIEQATFPQPWSKNFFIYISKTSKDLFLVAEINEEIVGYIVGEVRDSRDLFRGNIRSGHILNVAVKNGLRGKGIGSFLMDKQEANMKEKKVSQIMLEVRVSNVRAQNFYRRRGYIVTGQVKDYYIEEDALIMVKFFSEIADII